MVKLLVNVLVFVIDVLYSDRPYPRFYVLETVARVPYFAYTSVLHFYETLGLWRKADWLKVHFAESWNEMNHLLIMEALGGGNHWGDRILAQTVGLIYYWIIALLYSVAPSQAYFFMEEVEKHAFHTYDKFLTENEAELKETAAPEVAIKYYRDGDLYMFDEFQTTRVPQSRRPQVDNLYDVFVNIRDDENEHVKTMAACQHPEAYQSLQSPHTAATKNQESDVEVVVLSEVEKETETGVEV